MLTNTHMPHSFTFLASLLSADVHVKVLSYLFSYKLVSIESLHFSMSLLIALHCPTVWESTLEDTDISRLRKPVTATQFCTQIHTQTDVLCSQLYHRICRKWKRVYYYSGLNFSLSEVYSLIVLLTRQLLSVDILVQVSQSYQVYHGRMHSCAFGTHGHWRSLLGHCRSWKPLGSSAAPHLFFWLSHSDQLCLTIGLEEH